MADVTDFTFEQDVLQASTPTLVDFWAERCKPCKMLTPILEEIAGEYSDHLQVLKMDVDANPNTPARLGIMGIPTLILFKQGQEIARLIGYKPKDTLLDALLPHLDNSSVL